MRRAGSALLHLTHARFGLVSQVLTTTQVAERLSALSTIRRICHEFSSNNRPRDATFGLRTVPAAGLVHAVVDVPSGINVPLMALVRNNFSCDNTPRQSWI